MDSLFYISHVSFETATQVGAAMALNFLAIAITFLLASSVSKRSLPVGRFFLNGFSGLFVFWNWPSILFTWMSSRLSAFLEVSVGGEGGLSCDRAEGDSSKR